MSYTGVVTRGGRPDVRTLPALVIRKISVSEKDNNVYLLTCRATGAQLLIDAASDFQSIVSLIAAGNPKGRLDFVATTHRHSDHHSVLESVTSKTGAKSVAGLADAVYIPVPPRHIMQNQQVIKFGEIELTSISLRGHTEGSIALLYRELNSKGESVSEHLFTGDSLFPGGVGRTETAKQFRRLFNDVKTRVFDVLPDRTWVYPGHGVDTTLGAERPHLEQWKARGW